MGSVAPPPVPPPAPPRRRPPVLPAALVALVAAAAVGGWALTRQAAPTGPVVVGAHTDAAAHPATVSVGPSPSTVVATLDPVPAVPPASVLRARSRPVSSVEPHQVIRNLAIDVGKGPAITVTHDDVLIENVLVTHSTGPALVIRGAARVRVVNLEIVVPAKAQAAPGSGALAPDAVLCRDSTDLRISNVLITYAATGVTLDGCTGARVDRVAAGTVTRGLAAISGSDGASLSSFSVQAVGAARPAVSVTGSGDVAISDGRIDAARAGPMPAIAVTGPLPGAVTVSSLDVLHAAVCLSATGATAAPSSAGVTVQGMACGIAPCPTVAKRLRGRTGPAYWAGGSVPLRLADSGYDLGCPGVAVTSGTALTGVPDRRPVTPRPEFRLTLWT